MSHLQKTIKTPIYFKGIGLHTGENVNICLKPSEFNTGIKFKRTDVESTKRII